MIRCGLRYVSNPIQRLDLVGQQDNNCWLAASVNLLVLSGWRARFVIDKNSRMYKYDLTVYEQGKHEVKPTYDDFKKRHQRYLTCIRYLVTRNQEELCSRFGLQVGQTGSPLTTDFCRAVLYYGKFSHDYKYRIYCRNTNKTYLASSYMNVSQDENHSLCEVNDHSYLDPPDIISTSELSSLSEETKNTYECRGYVNYIPGHFQATIREGGVFVVYDNKRRTTYTQPPQPSSGYRIYIKKR
jgi:hypothetical protein